MMPFPLNRNKLMGMFMVLLTGCAANSAQHTGMTHQLSLRELTARVIQLEAQQRQLSEAIAKSANIPTGIVAIPAARRSGVYNDQAIIDATNQKSHTTQQNLYRQAIMLYHAGDIDQAISSLKQYLAQGDSGDSEQMSLARYWLGDAYYSQREYGQASQYLSQYLQEMPSGDKAQEAREKLVHALRSLGRHKTADILSQPVSHQLPSTTSASESSEQ